VGAAGGPLRTRALPNAGSSLLLAAPHNIWELGIFRMLAGFGVGDEFVGVSTFVAEELPEARRVLSAGVFNSGYYVGTFVVAGLNYVIGARYYRIAKTFCARRVTPRISFGEGGRLTTNFFLRTTAVSLAPHRIWHGRTSTACNAR
jgi:MFS family permease